MTQNESQPRPTGRYAHELPLFKRELRPRSRNRREKKAELRAARQAAKLARIPFPHKTVKRKTKAGTLLPHTELRLHPTAAHNYGHPRDKTYRPRKSVPRVPTRRVLQAQLAGQPWAAVRFNTPVPEPTVTRQQHRHRHQRSGSGLSWQDWRAVQGV